MFIIKIGPIQSTEFQNRSLNTILEYWYIKKLQILCSYLNNGNDDAGLTLTGISYHSGQAYTTLMLDIHH